MSRPRGIIANDSNPDPRVLLWGVSMGAEAALTAISQRRFPIRAARLVDSETTLSQLWDGFPLGPRMEAAYGESTTVREAHLRSPKLASSFAGVPMLFSASLDDTTVLERRTDAFRTYLTSVTDHLLVVTAGTFGGRLPGQGIGGLVPGFI